MEKYLFTDGTNGVREVQSQEELQTLIASAAQPPDRAGTDGDKIKIWIFNTNEWIGYKSFSHGSTLNGKHKAPPPVKNSLIVNAIENGTAKKPVKSNGLIKKLLFFVVGAAGIFLIYNFTKVKWEKTTPLNVAAGWPANVQVMDADSLIQTIEETRGQPLDKITKTNLRIRNTWPDRIALQLNSDHDISTAGSRYYNMEFSIDNSTGYNIDNAVVKLTVWKNNEVSATDTFRLNNISYAAAAKRTIDNVYRGDSVSVSFQSIKAKAFNFCYSADKKSNYGNAADKWYCK